MHASPCPDAPFQLLSTPLPYYNAINRAFYFSCIERGSVRLSAETLAILVEYFVVLFSFSWNIATKCRNTTTSVPFNFFSFHHIYPLFQN